jgi:hypothetical protein
VLWSLDARGAPAPASPRLAAELVEIGAGPELAAAMGRDARLAAGRFVRGCRCFAARVEGGIAAYAWVSTGSEWIGEIDSPIQLSPAEAYVWNCVTLPPYRRRRLYTALLGLVAARLGAEGVRRVWVATLVSLPHAGRGVATAGFRPAAHAVCLRVAWLRLLWLVAVRQAEPELAASARRVLGGRLRVGCRAGATVH